MKIWRSLLTKERVLKISVNVTKLEREYSILHIFMQNQKKLNNGSDSWISDRPLCSPPSIFEFGIIGGVNATQFDPPAGGTHRHVLLTIGWSWQKQRTHRRSTGSRVGLIHSYFTCIVENFSRNIVMVTWCEGVFGMSFPLRWELLK